MRTNKEKYNHYINLLNQKVQPFIDAKFPNGKPEKFFSVSKYSGIAEHTIISIKYSFQIFHCDKPSKKDVLEIKALYENTPDLSDTQIYLYYTCRDGKFNVSGAEKLSEILSKKHLSFDANDLADELQRLKELYEPREGYIKCAYCGKQNSPENTIYDKLIFRDWDGRKQFVNEKTLPYCRNKPCASYDQMAYEG
jgi:hypothetical protein